MVARRLRAPLYVIQQIRQTEIEAIKEIEAKAKAVEVPKKIDIAADIKHANKVITSKANKYSEKKLTRIDVKKPAATSSGKKRLSLKKKS